MKPTYEVNVVQFDVLEALDGVWTTEDFVSLLDAMEYGDTSGICHEELRDMCLLSLQDLEAHEAAELILRHRLTNRLSSGEIKNMSHEMLDEKLWEEYADMALHETLFNIGSLLYCAFPSIFPEPDAVCVRLAVTAVNEDAKQSLSQTLTESFLVRLLADGMESSAVLHRIFGEQLRGQSFPEADLIVWTINKKHGEDHTLELEVISSGYWLDTLRDTRAYESHAYADETH